MCVCVYSYVCVDSIHLDVEYSKIILSTSLFFDELENIFKKSFSMPLITNLNGNNLKWLHFSYCKSSRKEYVGRLL